MHRSINRLDKLSAQCFDTFVRGIVNIFTNEAERLDIRIAAAKEFSRQLSSQSKSFALMQMKKWNDLDSRTKDDVRNKVSAENVVAFPNKFVVAFIHTASIICYS